MNEVSRHHYTPFMFNSGTAPLPLGRRRVEDWLDPKHELSISLIVLDGEFRLAL